MTEDYTAGQANIIAFNTGAGIYVMDSGSSGDTILLNLVYSNSASYPGIKLDESDAHGGTYIIAGNQTALGVTTRWGWLARSMLEDIPRRPS